MAGHRRKTQGRGSSAENALSGLKSARLGAFPCDSAATTRCPAFYEFFCGGGMARAGLEPEWGCLFANDFDPRKGAAYAANWGSEQLRIADVASLRAADLPGRADLAWASFPCQDLSLAGAGAGLDGARSGAFWGFCSAMRLLTAQRRAPRLIVLENVAGVLTSKGGADFAAICAALARPRLSFRRADDRRGAFSAAVASARIHHRNPPRPFAAGRLVSPGPPSHHASTALRRAAAALPPTTRRRLAMVARPCAAAREPAACRLPRRRAERDPLA